MALRELKEIDAGVKLKGLVGDTTVDVIAVSWHGGASATVTFRTPQGSLGETMVFAGMEEQLSIEESSEWALDANPDDLKLASEAYRISLAHLFDPYLAIRTSQIEPLPHQVSAVYQEMLPKMPLRFVLADDPGAGKTIMTGLLIKEMIARGDLRRCLIVSPGNLVEQWQDELYRKFNLRFDILTTDAINASVTRNIFKETNFCIARLDKLARDEALQEKLRDSSWDLIVCDEAHKMSATSFGNDVKYTKRYNLGKLLGEITENFVLLTATPHNGKPDDFELFLALVDADRFTKSHTKPKKHSDYPEGDIVYSIIEMGLPEDFETGDDLSDVMRRLVKEELLKFDGRPLFPERIAYTVNYTLSPAEEGLYNAVTDYVVEEFNRADRLDGKRRNSVGFALTILQRRLASSPEAIYQSLKRRRERLQARLLEMNDIVQGGAAYSRMSAINDDFDEDDFTFDEYSDMEDEIIDTASAAATAAELEVEIATLQNLEKMANAVRMSGEDRKWDELSRLLQDEQGMFADDGSREKLIIFTEHKDTLDYLATKIRSLLGQHNAVLTIKGGMAREERHRAEEEFKQNKDVRILVATDAAGEGINLQRAHLMVNYDLPWNPNRIEQRFGRIHRIGQTEVCHLWNLVAKQTREGQVFERLFNKLNEERVALGGRVFDILGRVTFEDKPLRELLVEAIRYGNQPDVKDRLNKVVDSSLNTNALKKLLEQYALTADIMDVNSVMSIKEDMERMAARKLEPHFIEAFFIEAFKKLGGQIAEREPGRYEILKVPFEIKTKDMKIGVADPVLDSYERICFEKQKTDAIDGVLADLVCPGHPLLDATVDVVLEKYATALKRGAILIDDTSCTDQPRMLYYLESAIQDGNTNADGTKRTVSRNIHFVELDANGKPRNAGYAPYLDYRAPTPAEQEQLAKVVETLALSSSEIERNAENYAIENILPEHLSTVRNRTLKQIEKIEAAVEKRLKAEISYWDTRAWELRDKEAAGKRNAKVTSLNAQRRADELAERLDIRMAELARGKNLMQAPPRVVGGALVIPANMLKSNSATSNPEQTTPVGRSEIEEAAMRAVMKIENDLGFYPKDVSVAKCGYDIESAVAANEDTAEGCALRLIEVKGRAAGATTVTVSKNEILTALNSPENFYLAVVEVDGDKTKTTYMRKPFVNPPDFSTTSVNFHIKHLLENAEVILEKEHIWQ